MSVDTLDRAELLADLGGAYGVGLILSVPELLVLAYKSQGWVNARIDPDTGRVVKGKRPDGTPQEWDAAKIALEIQNTGWYQSRDGMQRQAENARLSDPASWQRNVTDIAATLEREAVKMGADTAGTDLKALAENILKDNWDYIQRQPDAGIPQSVLAAHLVPLIRQKDGSFTGQAGVSAVQLRQMAQSYGVRMTDRWYADAVQNLAAGRTTEADLMSQIVGTAKSAWAGIGDRISETTSVADLASAYVQTMAEALELDPDQVNLDTPEIRRAMTWIDPSSGQPRQKSLWEFEQELRMDPRWERTRQGQQELTEASMKMLTDFGFVK